jgi:hypothetical protein
MERRAERNGAIKGSVPVTWFGGKSRAAKIIWDRLGNVENYIEAFLGSGAVLLSRPHAPSLETVNDKDRYVANFWRALRDDPDGVALHADWPINEADLEARHYWLVSEGARLLDGLMADPVAYDSRIAVWWVWGQCAWIGSGWCSGAGPWRANESGWKLRNAGQGINRQLPHLGGAGKGILDYLRDLSDRLRLVRVACGDWTRVLTPSVTFRHGMTGILLDPPYGTGEVDYSGGGNRTDIASEVREWAIENGSNPDLRIALCGYDGQFEMPGDWSVEEWKAAGGYSSSAEEETQGQLNRHRERVWFSPACIPAAQMRLFAPHEPPFLSQSVMR